MVVEGQAASTTNIVIEMDTAELEKHSSAESVAIATAPAISGNVLEDDTDKSTIEVVEPSAPEPDHPIATQEEVYEGTSVEHSNLAAYAVDELQAIDTAKPLETHAEEGVAVVKPQASVEIPTVVPPLKDTPSEREVDVADETADKSEQSVTILEAAATLALQVERTVGNAK